MTEYLLPVMVFYDVLQRIGEKLKYLEQEQLAPNGSDFSAKNIYCPVTGSKALNSKNLLCSGFTGKILKAEHRSDLL